jgi:hypothetical protein
MGYENVGRVWSPKSLEEYLATIKKYEYCQVVSCKSLGNTWSTGTSRPNSPSWQALDSRLLGGEITY